MLNFETKSGELTIGNGKSVGILRLEKVFITKLAMASILFNYEKFMEETNEMRSKFSAKRGLAVLILFALCASFLPNPALAAPVRNSTVAWDTGLGTVVLDISHGGEGTAPDTLTANAELEGNLTALGFTVVWAKGGINSLVRSLSRELAPKGIRVNGIAPRSINIGTFDSLYSEDELPNLEEKIPLGRLGSPEDIANVVVFLASDLSSFITGEVILVDGGRTYCG